LHVKNLIEFFLSC